MLASSLQWVSVGRVFSVDPAHRTLRVQTYCDCEAFVKKINRLHLRLTSGEICTAKIDQVRKHKETWIIKLTSGVPRDVVADWKGAEVLVEPTNGFFNQFRAIPLENLIGFVVESSNGECLGRVSCIYRSSGQDTIEFESTYGKRILVPLLQDITFWGVDWERGIIKLGDFSPYTVEHEN
ncbi:MAG TPA: hypothetical protein PKY35_00045 [Candidatus Hydrogenedentes bacterium]|nr:hypothetical protein [Candidatus Hydrogenedentota bacterium]HOL75391.1 hypothetical protein [Candidatus Hydrogenedentota bacterium]HPO84900.1 hypothetical protein [Candidatus Hydrogenedentota bacterium]